MFGRNLAIQGEIIGEGIQGNPYKLRGQQFRVFNIFDIDTYQYLTKIEMLEITENFNLLTVPTIFDEIELPETILAGKSALPEPELEIFSEEACS